MGTSTKKVALYTLFVALLTNCGVSHEVEIAQRKTEAILEILRNRKLLISIGEENAIRPMIEEKVLEAISETK